jgi:hypothetical protein
MFDVFSAKKEGGVHYIGGMGSVVPGRIRMLGYPFGSGASCVPISMHVCILLRGKTSNMPSKTFLAITGAITVLRKKTDG